MDCGPALPGFEQLAHAPLVILGEMHGQAGSPAIAGAIACREANATLALEVTTDEQPRIDAFLTSDGGTAAKSALLEGEHWKRPFQDGRSSTAMLALLERARTWIHAGLALRVVAIDHGGSDQSAREKAMAAELVRLVKENRGPVVMLVGNLHARTKPGAPWDKTMQFMAGYVLKDVPTLISLDERYTDGDGWVCFTNDPDDCGRKKMPGKGAEAPGTITLFSAPDENGYSGTYSVGPAVAADPARGLTKGQETRALIARFKAANRPNIVDDAPSGSVLSAAERADWCAKLIALAPGLPQSGDRLEGIDACAATLSPAHPVVSGVSVKLDVGFFFAKPYAAASYDRESKTLFLPLASLYKPWSEVPATRHEWRHARLHQRALAGDALASALMTTVHAPDYRPDGFYADEVLVNLCDGEQQREMTENYVKILRTELDAMKSLTASTAATHAGVKGRAFTSAGVERWVGGTDTKKSLALLEGIWKDASTALKSKPLAFAGDACSL